MTPRKFVEMLPGCHAHASRELSREVSDRLNAIDATRIRYVDFQKLTQLPVLTMMGRQVLKFTMIRFISMDIQMALGLVRLKQVNMIQ